MNKKRRSYYEATLPTTSLLNLIEDAMKLSKVKEGEKVVLLTTHCLNENFINTCLTALDNLIKGAAGLAVQSFNIINGFDETLGLKYPGFHPI